MSLPIVDVTLNNAREVLDASMQKLVLFQFWSARSEGCMQLSPVLERIVQQYPQQLLLAKVDCDQQPDLAMQFGVQSLPTVMMIKQGRPVDGFAGVETEQAVIRLGRFVVGFGLFEALGRGGFVDAGKEVAGFHLGVKVDKDLLDLTGNLRAHIDGDHGLKIAGCGDGLGDISAGCFGRLELGGLVGFYLIKAPS